MKGTRRAARCRRAASGSGAATAGREKRPRPGRERDVGVEPVHVGVAVVQDVVLEAPQPGTRAQDVSRVCQDTVDRPMGGERPVIGVVHDARRQCHQRRDKDQRRARTDQHARNSRRRGRSSSARATMQSGSLCRATAVSPTSPPEPSARSAATPWRRWRVWPRPTLPRGAIPRGRSPAIGRSCKLERLATRSPFRRTDHDSRGLGLTCTETSTANPR